MKKPIDKDFDNIRDYMIAVEAYVKFLEEKVNDVEEKVNELENQIWENEKVSAFVFKLLSEKEIFEKVQRGRDNC